MSLRVPPGGSAVRSLVAPTDFGVVSGGGDAVLGKEAEQGGLTVGESPSLGAEGSEQTIRRSARMELTFAALVLIATSVLVTLPSPR